MTSRQLVDFVEAALRGCQKRPYGHTRLRGAEGARARRLPEGARTRRVIKDSAERIAQGAAEIDLPEDSEWRARQRLPEDFDLSCDQALALRYSATSFVARLDSSSLDRIRNIVLASKLIEGPDPGFSRL